MVYRVLFYAGYGEPLYWNGNEKDFVPHDAAHTVYQNCDTADTWARYAKRNNPAIAENIFIKGSRR